VTHIELSIVVVSFNTREKTLACLASLRPQLGSDAEVVVVDNGSTDGSAAAIRAAQPGVTVIDAGVNLGFAAGVNRGVAASSGAMVLLLNPDTLVLPRSIDAVTGFARRHPEYGLYGGRTLRTDGTTDPSSCWGEASIWSLICFAVGLSTLLRGSRLFDPESLGRWARDTVREVPIVTGCLLLVARSDWDRLGGMDEAYFLYGEDADFSSRARRDGLRPVIVPDAVIVHEVGGSTESSGVKMCMVMAGKVTFLRRWWSDPAAAIGVRLLLAGVALRALLERLARRTTPSWSIVWARRADWRQGYPSAHPALFPPSPVTAV
jgi:GT2 family glycosyltransferase